jgi:hypothetical protein
MYTLLSDNVKGDFVQWLFEEVRPFEELSRPVAARFCTTIQLTSRKNARECQLSIDKGKHGAVGAMRFLKESGDLVRERRAHSVPVGELGILPC